MPYTPLEWKDGPQGGTPITAAALNRMEQGIVDAHAVVDSHANATSVHGATSSATPNRIIIRDSAGRAKVAAPSASDDIARKAEVDALDPSVRFQVSGCVGGSTSITLSSNGVRDLQAVSLTVPSGKALILKRARFNMINNLRLRVAAGPVIPSVRWTSESRVGDVTLNVLVSSATSSTTVWVQAFNPTSDNVDLLSFAGWWLDFAIVDA